MASEVDTQAKESTGGGLRETLLVIAQALILAIFVRIFLYQPFNIPSGSMKPTLLVGDFLFVSKFSYGYSKYSFPWSIIPFKGRIWGAEPKRGDVVVFKLPRDNSTDYIKRLIGLPGDRIQMIDGVLHINGKAVERRQIGNSEMSEENGRYTRAVRYVETLPNGVSYETFDLGPRELDNTAEFAVPAGHYFMMGDNRDNSTDSRVPPASGGVGYVPYENLIGRAVILFFSIDEDASVFQPWRWPFEIRWSRFFNLIH